MNTLQNAINSFLNHCKFEKNLSEKTLKAYRIDLLQLNTFLNKKEWTNEISTITRNEIRDFISSISILKPKSIKRKIASMKAMFNYLEFEDTIIINPFRKMRIKIKEPIVMPKVMDLKEINKIYNVAYERKSIITDTLSYSYSEALRNIVVVELLFTTGARVSEIANISADCINLDTGNIIIKGKGSRERIIHVCNKESISILRSYYKLYKDKIEKNGFFLINKFNTKLSDQSIRNIVRKLTIKSGIAKHITPHVFRHSFATLLLEKDVDIKYIQSLLGHSSITTTQIYTHVNALKQKQILRAKHPRKDFSMVIPNAG